MADSPGRLLSSICLGGGGAGGYGSSGSGQSSAKYGCVNIFLHLFDWNRRLSKKGLFLSKKLLPSTLEGAEQSGKNRRRRKSRSNKAAMVVAACEERLPMAKLLLIADEKRTNGSNFDDIPEENEEEEGEEEEELELENTTNASKDNLMITSGRSSYSSSDKCFPCSSETRSLQELLHTDHDDYYHHQFAASPPKMLHEFLDPAEQKPLFSLLIQEAKAASTSSSSIALPNSREEQSHQAPSSRNPKRSSNSLSRQVSSERPAFARRANSRKSSSSSPMTTSSSSSSSTSKCPRVATDASLGVAASGCGGFSRRTSGLFLEAAAKILDPRGQSSKTLTRVGHLSSRKKVPVSKVPLDHPATADESKAAPEEHKHRRSFEVLPSDIQNCFANSSRASLRERRSVSAPCSPGPRGEEKEGTVPYTSCASIRSLMELFLDDLEEDMELSCLSRSLISRSPREDLQKLSDAAPPDDHRHFRSIHLPDGRDRTVDELEEGDYVSFRDFLTKAKKPSATPAPPTEVEEDASTADEQQDDCCHVPSDHHENFGFMVHNPLFEGSNSPSSYYCNEEELGNDDDRGLEEILKSILTQTSDQAKQHRDPSRLTWLPDESSKLAAPDQSFNMYNNTSTTIINNKDGSSSCSDESHQLDSDSVEVTSESNCGEDCGQPSPVSVLDSPFDDDLPGKRGKRGPSSSSKSSRKRLDFSDDRHARSVTSSNTSSSSASSPSSIVRFQNFDTNALEEAEEYIAMVLEESGIGYHANAVTLLVAEAKSGGDFNAGIIGGSVFERLEDRMRVQQLIEHLESCSTSSSAEDRPSHHSLESLRAHYGSYHESRSRRRMVFDFVNEILGSIVARHLEDHHTRVRTGRQLAQETHQRVLEWKRQAFDSIHELVDMEISRVRNSLSGNLGVEVSEIGLICEEHIFKSMVEELARDLVTS
ncbi:hypothetical protein SELMODRAFT_441726 [Selaginella moellendorffii]|uniref:DUF4378 domain-containing protein n=1 Tax=Selaginella moellendorffii TaxID=88036 RepID=D8RLB7_SELML|nr:uncharacterized protein LOC9640613 [Selaginella moellendorffii]EFJ26886.1 hypothetical protein SELMODRAFT_441726 [Selaginella moellendorffii]|eukprot:XP_002971969.1 uncharacterized protein LOC9640613 [Selaginella moellendorffii]